MANDLDREISAEEKRVNIADPNHYAYPTYARAARVRRDNMIASVTELHGQLEEAEARYEEAKEELEKAQGQEARDRSVERMVDLVAERHAVVDLPEPVRRA